MQKVTFQVGLFLLRVLSDAERLKPAAQEAISMAHRKVKGSKAQTVG